MNGELHYKTLVERAGALFVGVSNGSVIFRSGPGEANISLYQFALRSEKDVQLAVKNYRERRQLAQC
jgi:hypothetical protein